MAAGVLAKKIIAPVSVSSSILEVGGSSDIEAALDRAIEKQDSIGGIIECSITQVPAGLGEPFFDSVEAVMSHMIFSMSNGQAHEGTTGQRVRIWSAFAGQIGQKEQTFGSSGNIRRWNQQRIKFNAWSQGITIPS